MKMKFSNKYVKWGITAFSVITAGILMCYLIFNASEFFANIKKILSAAMPVAVGLIIAYLLSPVVNFLEDKILFPMFRKVKEKKTGRKAKAIRGVSILLTIILVFLVIYGLIAMLISQIVPSIQTIVLNFDTYIRNVTDWMNRVPVENEELYGYITTMFTKLMIEFENWLNDTATVMNRSTEIIKTLSLSVIGFLGVLWDVIIGFIISIYVLASKETFVGQAKKIVYAIFEKTTANHVIDNMRFTHRTFSGFISGKILDSLIIGILCFIGTTLIGTPYASLVSVIIGFTNVIPFFGPYLGAIPSAILILIVDLAHPLNCVYFLIFILILQQFDGNFLGPMILGDSTGLSGFWVIFSITVFGGLFGVMGMVIGVPTFAVFYAAVKGVVNGSLKKKELPTNTELYFHAKSVDEQGIVEIQTGEEEKSSEKRSTVSKVISKMRNKKAKNTENTENKNISEDSKPDASPNKDSGGNE